MERGVFRILIPKEAEEEDGQRSHCSTYAMWYSNDVFQRGVKAVRM